MINTYKTESQTLMDIRNYLVQGTREARFETCLHHYTQCKTLKLWFYLLFSHLKNGDDYSIFIVLSNINLYTTYRTMFGMYIGLIIVSVIITNKSRSLPKVTDLELNNRYMYCK